MNNEMNNLISAINLKPRVNSAPEVLMMDLKKHRRKKTKKSTKKYDKEMEQSNNFHEFSKENNNSKGSDNYLNISRNISIVSGKRLSILEQNKEKFEVQFCRINVLLITMQLGLGLSMSVLGVYLRKLSSSLSWKDCSYWAGIPLLFSGALGLYFCFSDYEIYRRFHISRIVRMICTLLSLVTAVLTLTSSIMSGSHGKWISDFSSTCDEHFIIEHSEVKEYPEKCCVDKHLKPIPNHQLAPLNETACICKTALNGNFSLLTFEREYSAMTCRYVFSALKDYFILQSSLMGVATGVCIWIVILHMKWKSEPDQSPISLKRCQYQSGLSESPSPSFLRFFPCQINQVSVNNKLSSSISNDRQIPRVIVHEIMDDDEIKPYRFY